MQPLNHDMDELFRKAAEDYPLKYGNSDWENISKKLRDTTLPASKQKSRNKKYFGLLLLIALTLLGSVFILNEFQSGSTGNRPVNDYAKHLSTKTSDLKTPQHDNVENVQHKKESNELEAENLNKENTAAKKLIHTKARSYVLGMPNRRRDANAYRETKERTSYRGIFSVSPSTFGANTGLRGEISKHILPTAALNFSTVDSAATIAESKAMKKNRGLYLGLMAGFDWSEVKSQPVTDAGYNTGIMLGYRFNKSWSFESGVLWNRKKYYTNGKYFSMSNVGASMPVGMEILAVDGQLTSFEFPFKVKYDFLNMKKSRLFFTSGISSNIYIKEKNNYLTKLNGVQEYHIGLYDDASYSALSLVSISLGYEYSLGQHSNIRLEPYIKIPLKRVGMGSMPVLSTGVNVAVSNLFKAE